MGTLHWRLPASDEWMDRHMDSTLNTMWIDNNYNNIYKESSSLSFLTLFLPFPPSLSPSLLPSLPPSPPSLPSLPPSLPPSLLPSLSPSLPSSLTGLLRSGLYNYICTVMCLLLLILPWIGSSSPPTVLIWPKASTSQLLCWAEMGRCCRDLPHRGVIPQDQAVYNWHGSARWVESWWSLEWLEVEVRQACSQHPETG